MFQVTPIDVGVAIIIKDNKILIGKRSSNVPFTGLWEFPGGKLEQNELPKDAIQRELMEELGVNSVVNDKLTHMVLEYSGKFYNLMCYFVTLESEDFNLTAHDEVKWVELKKVRSYKLLQSNTKILDKLDYYYHKKQKYQNN